MKINKTELLLALEKVKPGLAGKEIIEQTTSFAFLGDKVVTYNDEISISHPVPGLDIVGAIKAQELYSFLGKVKEDEISFELEDNQIIIHAGKAKAGLVLESEIKLPIEEEIGEKQNWLDISEEFREAVKFCHPVASKDMSRPILTAIYVNGKEIAATDAFQIILYKLKKKVPVKPFLLPASSARGLTTHKIEQIAEGGNGWMHFKLEGGTIFSARIIHGEFPDFKKHLEVKDGIPFDFPKKTPEVLEKALVFCNKEELAGRFPMATINIQEKEMKISTQSLSSWFTESIKTKYKGKPISFMIGIEFLQSMLSRVQSCSISKNKIGLTGDSWEMVTAITAMER